jgi:hypothetical protein
VLSGNPARASEAAMTIAEPVSAGISTARQ